MVFIDPLYKVIYLSALEDYPIVRNGYFLEEDYLDPSPGILTAEEILAIAEDAGGADYRMQTQNECTCEITYDSKDKYDGWTVRYFGNPNLPPMLIEVDEHTGEYAIIEK